LPKEQIIPAMPGAGVGTKRQELAKLVTGIPVTKRKVASIIFSDDIQAIPSVRRAFHQPLTEIDLIYINASLPPVLTRTAG
jgi:hypothetical protein